MVGHIAVPALDSSMLPASLSPQMITGLLRGELGFDGLVVTDGLSMKGVTLKFTQAEACVLALEAGVDILLAHARTIEEARPMVHAVLKAVEEGRLSEERIDASVDRIFKTKERFGLTPETYRTSEFQAERLDVPHYHEVSLQLARKSILLANNVKALAQYTVAWRCVRDNQTDLFGRLLRAADAVEEETVMSSYEELPNVLKKEPADKGLIIACSHNKRMNASVLADLNRFTASRQAPVILVHFGSPYDIERLPQVPTLLLHDKAPSLQTAAAHYLLSEPRREC
jgi:beta-N-acetylhexosaminidase